MSAIVKVFHNWIDPPAPPAHGIDDLVHDHPHPHHRGHHDQCDFRHLVVIILLLILILTAAAIKSER